MDQYVLYVQDTETTGLVPGVNEIIEVSFLRIFLKESGPVREQKTWLIRAKKPDTIDDEALAINKHKREDILWQTKFGKENYKEPADAIVEIEAWINEDEMSAHDRVFAGQNPMFDYNHMVEFWKGLDSEDTFPFINGHNKLILDTKQIALFFDVCLGKKREKYGLSSLIKSFGVKKGKTHRADDDARMTADLLQVFIDGSKGSIAESFKDSY
jgi:DNA polymerase III alpha subunit (gram-positive type)